MNREFQKQLVLPKSFENVEMLFNKLPSVVAVAIMDGIMLNCEILRLWHLEFSNIELNEKWSNSHALSSKLGSENPKKSYLGKLKIVPRFEFLLECGAIHMSACLSVFMSWISDEFGSPIVNSRNGLKIFKNGKKSQYEEKSGWPKKIRGGRVLTFDDITKVDGHILSTCLRPCLSFCSLMPCGKLYKYWGFFL